MWFTCARPRRSRRPLRAVATLPRLSEWGRVISCRQTQLRQAQKLIQVHLGVGRMGVDDVALRCRPRVIIATGAHWSGDGRGATRPDTGADDCCRMCSRCFR